MLESPLVGKAYVVIKLGAVVGVGPVDEVAVQLGRNALSRDIPQLEGG